MEMKIEQIEEKCKEQYKQEMTPVPKIPLFNLPQRPRATMTKTLRKESFITNFFEVKIGLQNKVKCYHMSFEPQLTMDCRKLKNDIFFQNEHIIQSAIGSVLAFSGRNVFSIRQIMDQNHRHKNRTVFEFGISYKDQQYIIKFRLVKEIMFSDLLSQYENLRKLPIFFLNNLFKNLMRKLGLAEQGKQSKFFNMNDCIRILNDKFQIIGGYSSSFNVLERGTMLRIDYINKLHCSESAFDIISRIYYENKHKDKEDKRILVKQRLANRIVKTNYDNCKYYQIKDVIFDKNCNNIFVQQNLSLMDYYLNRYRIEIKNPSAPLLQVFGKRGMKEKSVLLIPQLCDMTGIPQECEDQLRRQINKASMKQPQQKLQKLKWLMKKLNNNKNFSFKKIQQSIGVQFSLQPFEIQADILDDPQIMVGDKLLKNMDVLSHNRQFRPAFKSNKQLNSYLIHFSDMPGETIDHIKKTFDKVLNTLQIKKHSFNSVNLHQAKRNTFMQQIKNQLNFIKKKHYNIVFIILPDFLKTKYGQLKKLVLTNNQIQSQIILSSSLKKNKSFYSIIGKVFLQKATKVGNVIWAPKIPILVRKTMLVGIDISNSTFNKKTSFAGCCATINQHMYKFYSCAQMQNRQFIHQHLYNLIALSLKAYYHENDYFPQEIIILREGCSQGQIKVIFENQIEKLLKSFKQLINQSQQSYSPGLTYISIDKKPHQKFFYKGKQNTLRNPPPGTIINRDVVSMHYDFYLVSQDARQGSTNPCYYKVIYNSSKYNELTLQELLYSQCYNYANWMGSIRVPSVLQYARKLSTFLAHNVSQQITNQKLCQSLYYI